MASDTAIEWTDHTWNPWQGCTKVSEGCRNCYMFRDKRRYGQDPRQVVRSRPATFDAPIARYGARSTKGEPGTFKWAPGSRVFTCSWSDFFHPDADAWRADAWALIRQRPDLIFQVLTKRPDRVLEHLPEDWGAGYRNVWLGTSVEDERTAGRVAILQGIPAALRFLSMEPLLGPVDLLYAAFNGSDSFGDLPGIHWVIVGGESGPDARRMAPEWARDLRDQCDRARVPFHFKQWGAFGPSGDRIGKVKAGRTLDGRTHNGRPVPTNLVECEACTSVLYQFDRAWAGPQPADGECPQCGATGAFRHLVHDTISRIEDLPAIRRALGIADHQVPEAFYGARLGVPFVELEPALCDQVYSEIRDTIHADMLRKLAIVKPEEEK